MSDGPNHESTSNANGPHIPISRPPPPSCFPHSSRYVPLPNYIRPANTKPHRTYASRLVLLASKAPPPKYCTSVPRVPFGGVCTRPQSHGKRRCKAGLCEYVLLRSRFGRMRQAASCSVGEMHALHWCAVGWVWRWECDGGGSGARSGIAYLIFVSRRGISDVCACQMCAFHSTIGVCLLTVFRAPGSLS